MALRRRFGARVIQLPSGSMPTTSLCACWLIWRMRVLRYFSGIQSFGSIFCSASILAWKRSSRFFTSVMAFSWVAKIEGGGVEWN